MGGIVVNDKMLSKVEQSFSVTLTEKGSLT